MPGCSGDLKLSVLETAETCGFPALPSISIALLASDSVLDSNELALIFRLSFFLVSFTPECEPLIPFLLLVLFGVATIELELLFVVSM